MKKGLSILIVEDESALLEVLADKFGREGFLAFTAGDGREGLKAALKCKPDIIVLDIIMPSMDGLQMLKRLRENKWGQNVPVLILSNLSDSEEHEGLLATDKRLGYLVKSNWGLDDVVKKVKETLGILL
jgi:DNA-binding response OmpR family regulator